MPTQLHRIGGDPQAPRVFSIGEFQTPRHAIENASRVRKLYSLQTPSPYKPSVIRSPRRIIFGKSASNVFEKSSRTSFVTFFQATTYDAKSLIPIFPKSRISRDSASDDQAANSPFREAARAHCACQSTRFTRTIQQRFLAGGSLTQSR